ncbi:MAG: signal peptidase I [Acidobacteriia bacterium]|nr:signal peptidase I [Terriglobia bacterium]
MESTDISAFRRFSTRFADLRNVRRGFVADWVVTLVLLLFGWSTLLQAYVIPSPSMQNSLLIGDHLLVDRLVYAPSGSSHLLPYRDVRRGDIIVFQSPVEPLTLVKRAIGIPGDHIRLVNKQLVLNGKMVSEPYALHIDPRMDPYRDNFPSADPPGGLNPRAADMLAQYVVNGELVVPPGFLFAMGDNREDSNDSRYIGLIPRENIIGTPFLIYWSYEASTEDLSNPNIGFDHVVDMVTHFFTKTRWPRAFHLIRGYPLHS